MATERTHSECPENVKINLPVLKSHTLTTVSPDRVIILLLSLLMAIE